MTRKEIYFHVQRVAQQTAPHRALDIRSVLYDMSVAEQIVEDRTGRVVRKSTITLSADNATGEYDLPADLRAIESIQWAPAGGKGYWPVEVYAPLAFDRVRQSGVIAGSDAVAPQTPAAGGTIFAVRDMTAPDVLTVYPAGIAGTLTVRYKPEMTPYSPSDDNWSDYGDNPEDAMEANGLDESMSGMIDGIVRFCAARMLEGVPGGMQLYGAEIALRHREFNAALSNFAKRSVEPGLETTPPVLRPFGGVH